MVGDYRQSDIRGESLPDFACGEYRVFENYDETFKYWNKIKERPDLRQYYGQGVLIFKDITELQTTIFRLQKLAEAVNKRIENNIAKKEFGDNGVSYQK